MCVKNEKNENILHQTGHGLTLNTLTLSNVLDL